MYMVTDRLFDKVVEKRNPSVLGLDTRFEYLPEDLLELFDETEPFESATYLIEQFNIRLIQALCDIIPCVKIQMAYYEMYGDKGVKAAMNTAAYANESGMLVIMDAKRNDIGSTAEAYSSAFIGRTRFLDEIEYPVFDADFVTVNPYLGTDGIQPFLEDCNKFDKGLFVLVKTSNPSAGDFQDIVADGKPVYMHVAEKVADWGSKTGRYGYSNIGAVVGATYPEQAAALRNAFPSVPFLVPGYGTQGATGEDIVHSFDENGLGALVNASRSIITAHMKTPGIRPEYAAKEAALRMQKDILAALAKAGKLSY